MKTILMMIMSVGFIGNVMAECAQDIGYLAPVELLPACESGISPATKDGQSQFTQKVDIQLQVRTKERAQTVIAGADAICPQDIGYLAPPELLPPCSFPELSAMTADGENQWSEAPIARQAAISQPILAAKK